MPNHFSVNDNKCIYAAITDLAQNGVSNIDSFNIYSSLNSSDATRRMAENITVDMIQELIDNSFILARNTLEEYKMLVENVLDSAFRRDLFSALERAKSWCRNETIEDLGKKVYSLMDETMLEYTATEEVPEFKSIVDELWSEIEQHQNGGSGIPFKFPTLNEYVTMEPGELVVIGAPPKGGKSILLLNIAVDVLRRGVPVMYIDSELSNRLFLCRMVSHLTGISFNHVKNGHYSSEDEQVIQEQLEWIKSQNFVHLYMPIFDQKSIYTSAKKVQHRFGKFVLIVDYLKSTGDTDAFATYQELGRLTDLIKNDICGAMNIPGLAAAQLTEGGRLADSAKIARNASTIMTVTDKTIDEIEEDGASCGTKKLYIPFNRNGMQMVKGEYIDLNFDGNKILYSEAKQHIPQTPF